MKDSLRLVLLGDERLSCELPESGMLVVGRSPERAGFVVPGQGVDDAHFAIGRTKGGGWAVKDLGSEYGTLLNGERVSSARLQKGDKLLAGSRRFEVCDPGEEPRPEEASVKEVRKSPTGDERRRRPRDMPERIGGYRIDRLLGRGGAGKVYLALQENLNRPVALKILAHKYAADATFIERFQSEARAAAALSHPNVVVVHDVGEDDGRHYLSMEFMPGGSLEQRLAAAGPLPWRQVLDVLADAAAGLVYAESRGIVHRDIKPANLMLTGAGTVKIADLGLATSSEAEGELGDEGRRIVGTPHFMSPEQARGERVDHRSDLYSLGATAYRLLSGHTPFEGGSTRDILRALLNEEPTPLHEHVEGLPDGLEALIERLLAKSPDERFDSAEELRSELDRMRLAADHGQAFPDGSQPKPGTSKRALPLLLLVGIGIAGVLAYSLLPGDPGPGPTPTSGPEPVSDTAASDSEPTDDASFFDAAEDTASEIDEEQRLRILEAEALFALNDIPRDLPREERIASLEELVRDHPAAPKVTGEARAQLAELRAEIAAEAEASSRWEEVLENARVAWRTRAGWPPAEGQLPDPASALSGLRSLSTPPDHEGDERYLEARTAFEAELLATSRTALEEELAELAQLEEQGEFEAARPRLEALLARLDFPEPLEDDPTELGLLRALAASVRTRLEDLGNAERRWREAHELQVRQKLAASFGRGSGSERALRRLELELVQERIDAVERELGTRPESLASLQLDLAHLTEALDGLVAAFAENRWRRRAIQDPTGRGSTQKVSGISPRGITFERDPAKELAWAQLRADSSWYLQLFKDRLEREYTPDESRGVSALLRWVSVAEAVDRSLRHLGSDRRDTLSDEELLQIRNSLGELRNWLEGLDEPLEQERRKLEREERALELLTGAIRAEQERSYALSVARLEELLFHYRDTLCVLLLSDGRALPPAPPVQPAADEPDPADSGPVNGSSSTDEPAGADD